MKRDILHHGPGEARQVVLVDGHVHLHDPREALLLLSAADANLRRAWTGGGKPVTGLLLAGVGDDHPLEHVRTGPLPEGWALCETSEPGSLVLDRDGHARMVVIEGRQVRTKERLELLAFGVSRDIPSPDVAEPFETALRWAVDCAGLVVVPWAFGKWSFGRKNRIERALAAISPTDRSCLMLGDNSNRPRALPVPPALVRLASQGYGVLPGTDPFPLSGETERAGSFGAALTVDFDPDRPATCILSALAASGSALRTIGGPVSTFRFVRNQIGIRIAGTNPLQPDDRG